MCALAGRSVGDLGKLRPVTHSICLAINQRVGCKLDSHLANTFRIIAVANP